MAKKTHREPPAQITNPDLGLMIFTACTEWVASLHDQGPDVQAVGAGWLIEYLETTITAVANQRAAAVRELRAADWSLAEIGVALGLSRSRVDQLANR